MTRPNSQRGGVLRVILIIFGVLVLIVVCTGIYVAMHWKGWAATAANNAAQELVNDSGLPPEQKEVILREIRQFGDDFKSGTVSMTELAQVARAVQDGPIIPLAGVQATRHKYIDPSDMTSKEKAEAILTLQRFARGLYEKSIRNDEVKDVVKPIASLTDNGRWKLKDNPTRMEIDQFVANAKVRADEAKIPNEPFDLNIADEIRKVLHERTEP
jgi:hypothetical protein